MNFSTELCGTGFNSRNPAMSAQRNARCSSRAIDALWERTTAPESHGVLLLIMDLSGRAWSGSERAKSFYAEQQKIVDKVAAALHER
jgi:hypothetical protein